MSYLDKRGIAVHLLFIGGRSHLPQATTTRLNNSSHNLVMKHLPGADPELVLLGHRYEELEVRPWKPEGGGAKGGARVTDSTPPLLKANPTKRNDPRGDQ